MSAAEKLAAVPDQPLTVVQALAAVIADLPALGKDQRMSEGGRNYTYRGIEDIKKAAKPVLAAHGVVYAPHAITAVDDSNYQVKSGAVWERVRLTVTFRFYGPDGSYIEATTRGEGTDNGDKASNKAMTAAEKYALTQVLCIADGDDPDHSTQLEDRVRENQPPADPPIDAKRAKGWLWGVLTDELGLPADDATKERAAALWEVHGPSGDGPWPTSTVAGVIDEARREVQA